MRAMYTYVTNQTISIAYLPVPFGTGVGVGETRVATVSMVLVISCDEQSEK